MPVQAAIPEALPGAQLSPVFRRQAKPVLRGAQPWFPVFGEAEHWEPEGLQ